MKSEKFLGHYAPLEPMSEIVLLAAEESILYEQIGKITWPQ